MITRDDINRILDITESYQLHDVLMQILFDTDKRNSIYERFLQLESDLSYDWFTNYFQEEQANRKLLMQDYTPDCICKIVSNITGQGSVYDECCGIGGLTISMWNSDNDRTLYLEELSDNAIALLLFNLSIRGVNAYVRQADILRNTTKKCYQLRRNGKYSDITECDEQEFTADIVVSNPPYSVKFDDVADYKDDIRFSGYGILPKSKADYAFVLHGLSKLKDTGRMCFILPHGVLFRGAAEADIRRKLVDNNLLEAVIGLPEKLFLNTQIPVCLLIINKCKTDNKLLIIDASQEYVKGKKQNDIYAEAIEKITDAYKQRHEIEHFSHLADLEEIQGNDYNLNIPRYVDISKPKEPVDIQQNIKNLYDIESKIKETGLQLSSMLKDLTGPQEYIEGRDKLIDYLENYAPHGCTNICNVVDRWIEDTRLGLSNQQYVKLYDVAGFERSKKEKVYPAGSILIQISATKGQMDILRTEQTVEDRYGVIMPKITVIPAYLYYVLEMVMPDFLKRYQTGLNINPEVFKHLGFYIHPNIEIQKIVVRIMEYIQKSIENSIEQVGSFKMIKEYHLDNMFV